MGIEGWEQAGLAGLVIGALFTILFLIIKFGIENMRQIQVDHREERKEWRESDDKRTESFNSALKEVVDEFRREHR